ncbi:MAG: DNA internalization-related competence protein ComEC/Rec2 [Bacilli bacterium]
MIKLRTILLSNKLYILILIIVSFITLIRVNINYKSNFKNENIIKGKVQDIYIDGPYLKITLKSKDKIICNYYFKNKEELKNFDIKLGDLIVLNGSLENPKNNTIPNVFNYKKYLKYNKIYYTFKVESYKKIKNNNSIFYYFKNIIINHINKYKSSSYLKAFILGDTSYIDRNVYKAFQEIGISHLFAISGMHISFLSGIILFILKKLKVEENKRYIITSVILFLYLLICFSASVLRSFLFFFLLSINKIYYFYIKTINIFILTLSISLLINPFFIYNIGFLFSYIISFYLIILSEYLKKLTKIKQTIIVSIISFLVSFPLSIYNFYQVNILAIIYNLFFVPLISIFLFPFTLITFFIPFLDNILFFIINIFEYIVLILNKINIFKIILVKPYMIVIFIYYLVITLLLLKRQKKYLVVFLLMIFFHYNVNNIFSSNYLIMIDVGQGDSILIHFKNKNILIDTGGIFNNNSFKRTRTYDLSESTLCMLKSFGIRKLDFLILTHGDSDHMGEAINLVENFKVEKVIFNVGDYNYLEEELIKILNKKRIKYYKNIENLDINGSKLYFLNTKIYDNENDNSNVIYFEFNNYKFLFMGDAGIEKEKDILVRYDLKDIDFLKIGHHGSNTSSSKEFIESVNLKYSLISVGSNNRYGHPKDKVLDDLKNSKIYRTDLDGSIEIKLNKNGYRIRTYTP